MVLPEIYQPWFVLVVILVMILVLLLEKVESSWVFLSTVIVFILTGIIGIKDFLAGFANESIATIFLLIFATSLLQRLTDLNSIMDNLFKAGKTSLSMFFLKVNGFVAIISSVVNNTPVVAFFTPYLYAWGQKNNVAPSKLLIPLSYVAILGGMITLFGTSTNLVLNGLLEQSNVEPLSFFDFTLPGLLVTAIGLVFLLAVGMRLLPNNKLPKLDLMEHKREYIAELQLSNTSKIVGKTIAEAGLRNLEGVYLVEIIRNETTISPVGPSEVLFKNDILLFAGNTQHIIKLIQSDFGLELPKKGYLVQDKHIHLVEVVIPYNSSLIGKSVKESKFRNKFNAAILAIHRNGEKVQGKIGEMELHAGDMLFLSTGKDFGSTKSDFSDIYVFSEIKKWEEDRPAQNKWILMLLLASVTLVNIFLGTGILLTLISILVVAALTGFITMDDFRKEFDANLLIMLVSSLAIGYAMLQSGAADMFASKITSLLQNSSPATGLVIIFLFTVLITSFITNVAAVSISFPITYALIEQNAWQSEPFYLAIAFAASAAFITPFGYQTNMMVYGPGNYKFIDYVKIGAPLTVVYSIVVITYLILFYGL